MADAKIDIKAGGAEFSATGEPKWVGEQLDKFLKNAASLAAVSPKKKSGDIPADGDDPEDKGKSGARGKPLATYLKEKSATTNQVKKFLSTAVWLEAKGQSRISTSDITKALRDANQSRLGNPSECLNSNVSKGFCEKDGKQFFVTDDGKAAG